MIGRMILTKNMAGQGAGANLGGGAGPGGGGGAGGGPVGLSGGAGNPSSASILGLKVVGGKRVDNGRLAAIVEKVKRGSVADTIGHLRPGTIRLLQLPLCCFLCFLFLQPSRSPFHHRLLLLIIIIIIILSPSSIRRLLLFWYVFPLFSFSVFSPSHSRILARTSFLVLFVCVFIFFLLSFIIIIWSSSSIFFSRCVWVSILLCLHPALCFFYFYCHSVLEPSTYGLVFVLDVVETNQGHLGDVATRLHRPLQPSTHFSSPYERVAQLLYGLPATLK